MEYLRELPAFFENGTRTYSPFEHIGFYDIAYREESALSDADRVRLIKLRTLIEFAGISPAKAWLNRD